MAIPSSGNVSIKGAAGSGRSIDTEVASVSSGSLVTLSENAVSYNSVTSAPYGMREFMGYTHTLTNSITESKTLRDANQSGYAWELGNSDTYGMGMSFLSTGIDMYFIAQIIPNKFTWYIRSNWTSPTRTKRYQNNTTGTLATNSWQEVASYTFNSGLPDSVYLARSHSNNTTGGGAFINMYDSDGVGTYDLNPYDTWTTYNNGTWGYDYYWQTSVECNDLYWEGTTQWRLGFRKSGYYDWYGTWFKGLHDHDHDQQGMC